MALHLVPIPLDAVHSTKNVWWPYILKISERDKCDPLVKEEMLSRGQAQAFLVWDAEGQKPQAFIGVEYKLRGQDRVGSLVWLTGENRATWSHLFGELELYLREQQGCKAINAIARPGWSKHLKSNGYRETHRVFEREF